MRHIYKLIAGFLLFYPIMSQASDSNSSYNELTPEEQYVILHKGTERPGTGDLLNNKEGGTYICAQCNAPLYQSEDKFESHCGWPSFDDEIDGAVLKKPDADGRRTEILCNNCGGHLGHVFKGEGFTPKNTRHCVNSLSMNFVKAGKPLPEKIVLGTSGKEATAIFAGGCFWGVEYWFEKIDGVSEAESGYIGGHIKNPSYKQVCSGRSGHIEAVRVHYDPGKVSYEALAQLFFEIHDPTQVDRQGPDIGEQYRSVVFYQGEEQKEVAEKLIAILKDKGLDVVTKLEEADEFYPAEGYHQDYYEKKGSQPYCHAYTKRF